MKYKAKMFGRITIEGWDIRQNIFIPILEALLQPISDCFKLLSHPSPGRKHMVLLSGVMGECQEVHDYLHERLESQAQIFDTEDEYVDFPVVSSVSDLTHPGPLHPRMVQCLDCLTLQSCTWLP
jgi:hypothetical protein